MRALISAQISALQFAILLALSVLVISTFANSVESANRAYDEGKFEEAISIYEKALKESRSPGIIWYNMGNCYIQLNKPQKAVWHWKMAATEIEDFSSALYNIATVSYENRDYVTSIQATEQILRLEPNRRTVLNLKSALLQVFKSTPEAVVALEQFMEQDTTYHDGWFRLAEIYSNIGETGKAIETINRYPDNGKRYSQKEFTLAVLYEREGNSEKALHHYFISYESDSKNQQSLDGYIRVLRKLGYNHLAKNEEQKRYK